MHHMPYILAIGHWNQHHSKILWFVRPLTVFLSDMKLVCTFLQGLQDWAELSLQGETTSVVKLISSVGLARVLLIS